MGICLHGSLHALASHTNDNIYESFCIVKTIYNFFLLFPKCPAAGLSASRRCDSVDINMIRCAFILSVVDTLHSLAVNTDGLAGMIDGAGKGVHPFSPAGKALAAGIVPSPGMLSSHTDLALPAEPLVIIDTILRTTS